MPTISEERLNELEVHLNVQEQIAGPAHSAMIPIADVQALVVAARERNELEAENAALKDVNWDISYPDGESLATLKAERDALKEETRLAKSRLHQEHLRHDDAVRREQALRADNAALREALRIVNRCLDTPNWTTHYAEMCQVVEQALAPHTRRQPAGV